MPAWMTAYTKNSDANPPSSDQGRISTQGLFISLIDRAEERISEFKERSFEIIQ